MFAIGQMETRVNMQKVYLPKEFNLKRKGRKIYGTWVGDHCMYLSDEEKILRGKAGIVSLINIDSENKISVPGNLEQSRVLIRGCISVIELKFIH